MKGTQHSFIDLFESEYLVGDKKNKIESNFDSNGSERLCPGP